jgi:hypothetical protein
MAGRLLQGLPKKTPTKPGKKGGSVDQDIRNTITVAQSNKAVLSGVGVQANAAEVYSSNTNVNKGRLLQGLPKKAPIKPGKKGGAVDQDIRNTITVAQRNTAVGSLVGAQINDATVVSENTNVNKGKLKTASIGHRSPWLAGLCLHYIV